MGKTLKVIISFALILALVGVITLYAYMDSNSKANHVRETNQEFISTQDEIQQQIDALYYDEKKDFLSESFQMDSIDPIKDSINKLNESTSVKNQYLDQLVELQLRYEAQTEVNDFFAGSKEAIRGNKVNDDLMIRDGLKKDKVQEVKQKYYYLINETEEGSEELADLDDFQKAINTLIDQVEERVGGAEEIRKLFQAVEKIEIVDGNIGQIAQAMHLFDQRLEKVKQSSPTLYKQMDKKAADYTDKMIRVVAEIAKNVPQYYQLLESSLEPSKRLSKALELNKDRFDTVEITTSQEIELPEVSESSSNDYYYEDPVNTWTDPEPAPPTTSSEPVNPQPIEPTEPEEGTEYSSEDNNNFGF